MSKTMQYFLMLFCRPFAFIFKRAPDNILVISLVEFPRPRNTGIFEIRLGKSIIFDAHYDFHSTTLDEIKRQIASKNINLHALKFDKIKFSNISTFGIQKIESWFVNEYPINHSEFWAAESANSKSIPTELEAINTVVIR